MSENQRYLVTRCHAVNGDIIRASSPEEAAHKAFARKTLSKMPGGVRTEHENFVTVYPLGASYEFQPTIEYTLTGVKAKP